jgi:hypothetical protein
METLTNAAGADPDAVLAGVLPPDEHAATLASRTDPAATAVIRRSLRLKPISVAMVPLIHIYERHFKT